MPDPNTPFEGEFSLVKNLAANVDFSDNYTVMTAVTDRVKIQLGPFLSTDHREELVGSSAATVNVSLQKLTAAQIIAFAKNWKDKDLMHLKFMAEAGTLDTPTATNIQFSAQFFLVFQPMLPMEQDAVYTYETGDIQAVFSEIDDGTDQVTVGTEVV